MQNIYMIGDMESNTGPARASGMLKKGLLNLGLNIKYTTSKNKIMRMIDLIVNIPKSKYIIICSSSKLNKFAIIFSKILKKKIFYIMHGYGSYEYKINSLILEDDKEYLEIKKYEKFIFSNVDKIFCVSKTFMNFMKEKEKKFSGKFDYNFNGVDIDKFRKINNKIVRNKNQIISIGGGMRRKNNIKVCEAIENLNNNYGYNLKFKVIGKGYTDKELIKNYSFVEYYDEISHEDVLKLLRESNIYIQNSYLDTFCISVLEGLFCGCSCLFSKYVGVKDVFNNLQDNYIIKNPDDINELSEKIRMLLNKNNNKYLMENINLDLIKATNVGKNLIEKIENEYK